MSSRTTVADDCPEPCRQVLNVVEAEQTTLIESVSRGDLRQADLALFLEYTQRTDHAIDAGILRFVRIIYDLLEMADV